MGEMSFEEALKNLESSAAKISEGGATLEETLSAYEEGIKYYNICKGILDNAKQRIEKIGAEGYADGEAS
jgi:exodeoxyribonuclease VII small subunit